MEARVPESAIEPNGQHFPARDVADENEELLEKRKGHGSNYAIACLPGHWHKGCPTKRDTALEANDQHSPTIDAAPEDKELLEKRKGHGSNYAIACLPGHWHKGCPTKRDEAEVSTLEARGDWTTAQKCRGYKGAPVKCSDFTYKPCPAACPVKNNPTGNPPPPNKQDDSGSQQKREAGDVLESRQSIVEGKGGKKPKLNRAACTAAENLKVWRFTCPDGRSAPCQAACPTGEQKREANDVVLEARKSAVSRGPSYNAPDTRTQEEQLCAVGYVWTNGACHQGVADSTLDAIKEKLRQKGN